MHTHKVILTIVAVMFGFAGTQSALAQTDIFMEVPDIPGESTGKGHERWIDVVNFHYAAMQEQVSNSGRGRSRSSAVVEPVIVGKMGDAASVYLNLATLQGKSFDEIVVEITDGSILKFRYVFTNAVFVSYTHDAEEDNEGTEESVGISFETIRVIYYETDDNGGVISEHEIEYDVAAGV